MIPTSSGRTETAPRNRGDGDSAGTGNTIRAEGVRPRNKRLVSTAGAGLGAEQELVSTSATSTPGGSRAASPIPSRHPSRSASRRTGDGTTSGLLAPPQEGRLRASSPLSFRRGGGGGIWEGWGNLGQSWSAIQGLANSVLGVDDEPGRPSTSGRRGKDGAGPKARGKLPAKWGPETHLNKQSDGGIGQGSTAEREAAVKAKQVARVMEGRDEGIRTMDTNGKYKRRTSSDEQRPGTSQENDYALVYIHPVQKDDTLQGVVLKYNCKPDVFRKANRFWPNDSIQVRKEVILPVDACTIKGIPCGPPALNGQGVDLLAPTPAAEDPPITNSSWPESISKATSAERPGDDNAWTHVRWVLLDASPNVGPVEIARMPRKTLGYFPPRRRKSTATMSTAASSPRTSLDGCRIASSSNEPGSTSSTPSRRTSNLGPRPLQGSAPTTNSYFPPQTSNRGHSRRESVGETAARLGWMHGPGGVGTFNRNVRKPGPAQDGFNSWAKKHIPGLAIDQLPSTSLTVAEQAHFGFADELASISEATTMSNRAATPGAGAGQGLGLENAAAAIEGWVRRMGTKSPGTPLVGSGRPVNVPDLIELLDGASSDDGRGFELSQESLQLRGSTPVGGGSGREDLDAVVRGRTQAGGKRGKND